MFQTFNKHFLIFLLRNENLFQEAIIPIKDELCMSLLDQILGK